MALIPINSTHPHLRTVKMVADALASGAVVAYPTDTVYGLGCSLLVKRAIERLYELKDKSRRRPFSFLVKDLSQASRYAQLTDTAYRVLRAYTPGPYCWVLESTKEVPRVLLHRRTTIGIRIPDHPFCQKLVEVLGCPIVNTTASDPDSDAPLTDPETIERLFKGRLDLVVDAGPGGLMPSTVVSITAEGTEVLREGKGEFPRD